jgi:hypothetical protein
MRRLALILCTLVALAGLSAGAAAAYIAAHGKATARFHVEDGGDVTLDIGTIAGSLSPGESASVPFTVSNPTGWSVRVKSVRGDDPLVTNLPADCDADNFDFDGDALNARLGPDDHVSGSGKLKLKRGADQACAGSDPVLHLAIQ